MQIEIERADCQNEKMAKEIGYLLNEYAKDPMGGGEAISEEVQNSVAKKLSEIPHSFTVLAYVDGIAAGFITAFENFSTFKCKPLISIHDIAVLKEFRGLGLSQMMLAKVEEEAKERGCCKITLEVLEGNEVAQNAYRKFGFEGYELDPEMGKALFWEKGL